VDVPQIALTGRQQREQQYYEAFVKHRPTQIASLASFQGEERRPWNPYWFVIERVMAQFRSREQRLLDFGCGPGRYAIPFAHVGYDVYGFDVSPANVDAAAALAVNHGVSERTHFTVGVAEALDYASESFDVIVGIDILHHVEIARAVPECLRVLKPGGVAIFKEPVEAPVFDTLRNSPLGLAIVPKHPSLEAHLTEDERKLRPADLRLIRQLTEVRATRFRLLSRIDTLLGARAVTAQGSSRLEIVDRYLLRAMPFIGSFAGTVVLECRHR
jgi:2-polyprenyl-3-methyl-5-hydroxy-6-metoxy-1,4-benzoquinol methylase